MDAEEKAANSVAVVERRAHQRFVLDEDSILMFVNEGLPLSCRILDLSLEGCSVRTKYRLASAPGARVEIAFKLNGTAFRFYGAAQWANDRQAAGIRFVGMPKQRREDLAEALGEVEAAAGAKAAGEGAQNLAPERTAAAARAPQPSGPLAPGSVPPPASDSGAGAVPRPGTAQKQRDRRIHARCTVDTSAVICLVNVGSRVEGRILDLSLGGCRIATHEPFPVGIYTRVETEFRLLGLPFRLGGVVQAIHGRRQVGVRFLDMSDRKRQQVTDLIAEIEEMHKAEQADGDAEAADQEH